MLLAFRLVAAMVVLVAERLGGLDIGLSRRRRFGLSAELGSLSNLEWLVLNPNELSGEIPEEPLQPSRSASQRQPVEGVRTKCFARRLFRRPVLLLKPRALSRGRTAYRLGGALHEAGHALALSGLDYSDLIFFGAQLYHGAHPTIPDAAMNYDNDTDIRYPVGTGFSEPDCSPHPFDILVLSALYQTR